MNEHEKYAKTIANSVFKNNSKTKKISREVFTYYLESSFLAGQVTVLELLLKHQTKVPPTTAEEVIGDVQLILLDVFNTLNKDYGLKLKELNLDQLIKSI